MFKRVSCPLSIDFAAPALLAVREAFKCLELPSYTGIRWFNESSEYNDGLAIVIDAKASRTEVLVAEAVSMTVYDSIEWDTIESDYPEIEAEVNEALEGGRRPNDG